MGKNQTSRLKRATQRIVTAFTHFERRPQDFLLAIAVTAALAALVLLIGKATTLILGQFQFPGYHYLGEPGNGLSFMSNWDSPDYIDIAISGYTNDFWVNWFPLYPIALRIAHHLYKSWLDTSILVSWAFLTGAIFFYIKLARELLGIEDDIQPLMALLVFVLMPTGVFLVVPFAEGLLAMLGFGAVYFALKKRPLEAAVLAMFASATHITGIYFALAVGMILLEQGFSRGRALLATAIGSLGLIAYMSYLWNLQGNPFGFVESQQVFHHWTQAGFQGIITNMSGSNLINIILIILAFFYWKHRQRLSLAIFCLLFLAIPLVGHQYGGFDRYMLMAFPVPLMAYDWLRRHSKLWPYVAYLMGMAWVYDVILYTGGYIGS